MTASDGVVDAFIHEETCGPYAPCPACVQELQAQINAALAIHRPCHIGPGDPWGTPTEPWACEHGHYDEACITGIPDGGAVCSQCTDGLDNALPYPCPTASALGMTPTLAREDIW